MDRSSVWRFGAPERRDRPGEFAARSGSTAPVLTGEPAQHGHRCDSHPPRAAARATARTNHNPGMRDDRARGDLSRRRTLFRPHLSDHSASSGVLSCSRGSEPGRLWARARGSSGGGLVAVFASQVLDNPARSRIPKRFRSSPHQSSTALLHTHEVRGSSPLAPTTRKHLIYREEAVALNDTCGNLIAITQLARW